MTSKVFILLGTIQEIIGSATLWPRNIRKLFWKKFPTNFDRMLLGSFSWINGLNPVILLEWFDTTGNLRDAAARKNICDFFYYCENNRYYNLYGWNVNNRRYEKLDGTVKTYDKIRKVSSYNMGLYV